jgi:putative ABC transport system permease protein
LLQAMLVGLIGYGLGVGLTSLFGYSMRNTILAFKFPWQLLLFSGTGITLICVFSAVLSIRKVFKLEPAEVFRS